MVQHRKTRKGKRGRTRQKGGRKVGQGQYGIVYSPPLLCANGSNEPYKSSNYVGKQVHLLNRTKLERQRNLLLGINGDQQLTVPPLHICNLAPVQTNANFAGFNYKNANAITNKMEERKQQIIYKFAGKSLYAILDAYAKKDYTSLPPEKQQEEKAKDKAEIQKVFRALRDFLPRLQEFNRTFIHADLHPDNLVFDGTQFRMIDFDLFFVREEALQKALTPPPPVDPATLTGARKLQYLQNLKKPPVPIETKIRKFNIFMDIRDANKLLEYVSEDLNKPIFKELFPALEPWLESKKVFEVHVPELGITYTDPFAAFTDLFGRLEIA